MCILQSIYNVKQRIYKACREPIEEPSAECVERDLKMINSDNYFDKCCYVRYRKAGKMRSECLGIFREDFMDIPEFIDGLEADLPEIKIYEFNCNSSYLKIFVLVFALFNLLF